MAARDRPEPGVTPGFAKTGCRELTTAFEEEIHTAEERSRSPEGPVARECGCRPSQRGVGTVTAEFREVIVLRELEGMSYKEIAELCGIPVGTVMSCLARARQRVERQFTGLVEKGALP